MNYLDLFHGIGGFALGALWAGMKFENHYCSDIEPYCQKLYALRFPDSIQLGDITKIDFVGMKHLAQGEWIITGGFPCQDISIAGKGKGIKGERSGLWFKMWDAIRILRPRFVIAENVGAITFRGLDQVLGSLAEIGYDAEWQDIRASDVGAPHRRERIWIVAYPNRGIEWQGGIFGCRKNKDTTRERAPDKIKRTGEIVPNTYETGLQAEGSEQQATGIAGSNSQRNIPDSDKQGSQGRKQCEERSYKWPTWSSGEPYTRDWIFEPGIRRVAHGVSGRVDRLKGLGNSIVPQIAELLFNQIKDLL